MSTNLLRSLCLAALVIVATPPACRSQGAAAAKPEDISNSIGIVLVKIPAGEFMMGSVESSKSIVEFFPQYDEEAKFFEDEQPRHRVRITKPFYYGKYEITNAQFRQFVKDSGYVTQAERKEEHAKGSGGWGFNAEKQAFEGRDPKYNWQSPGFPVVDNCPVVDVTWNDAVAFCEWLSKKEGKTYRLPTEAEWEYAARAGTDHRYLSGDDPVSLAKVANTADADFRAKYPLYYPDELTVAAHDGFSLPSPVGSFPPNAFGICDVQGNVWEWTNDWYSIPYYSQSPTDDPQGPEKGELKVRRGGSWHTSPLWSRIAFRNYNTPESRYPSLGFRVVQEVK